MKRRWRRDHCCLLRSLSVAVVLLFAYRQPPPSHAAFLVAKDRTSQQQRFSVVIQKALEGPFRGISDERDRRSNGDVLPSQKSNSKKKSLSPSSPSSSSLKFRDMQDLLDSLSSPNETLLIVFTATNCGPCRLQKQELSEFRQRLTSERDYDQDCRSLHHQQHQRDDEPGIRSPDDVPLKMLAIDTEKWPHVGLAWFKVSKLPCVVVLRNKTVVARMEGLTRAQDLLEHVRPHLPPF